MTDVIYLDNAATTPTRPDVLQEMLPYLSDESFGNPSSAHGVGRRAKQAVERARERIARAVGAEPNDVFFTSGGTEADNLAIIGGALAAREHGKPFCVAVSAIEHPAVLAAAEAVERMGGHAIYLPVDGHGQLRMDALDEALAAGASVVSVMWVNNEVGIVQDIPAIAERVASAGAVFHTDAVQAVAKIPVSIADVPCTLLSLTGHKIGAPGGAGALIVRDLAAVAAQVHGGGQQLGIRPGTENVAGIVALGCAVEFGSAEAADVPATYGALRDDFERRLIEAIPETVITAAGAPRAPHISNVTIPGIDVEALLMHLDLAGIACSAGSACHTGSVEPSKVLIALGVPRELAVSSMRVSFYKQNTPGDVDRLMDVLPALVSKVRALAASLGR